MILRILGIIGASSFFVTGFSLLSDPSCVSADFGGARVIQITCRNDSLGAFSGIQAGIISLLIGSALLSLIFMNQIRGFFDRSSKVLGKTGVSFNSSELIIDTGISDNRTKKCPMCAEEIKLEAMICRFCQHSFLETGVQKFNRFTSSFFSKALSPQFRGLTVFVIIVGLIGLWYGLDARSESIKRNQLMASGEVCVYSLDGSSNYGCADYPNYKISFCGSKPFGELTWKGPSSDFEQIDQRKGNLHGYCTSPTPYLYIYQGTTNKLIGEYEITVWENAQAEPDYAKGDRSILDFFTMKIDMKN